jgi:hypothetical protein
MYLDSTPCSVLHFDISDGNRTYKVYYMLQKTKRSTIFFNNYHDNLKTSGWKWHLEAMSWSCIYLHKLYCIKFKICNRDKNGVQINVLCGGCRDEVGTWKWVGWEAWNMHQPKASAYYVDSGTALKSVGSKLELHVFCALVITSHKTWKPATEKIHLDLNNLTHFHFHNSWGQTLPHSVLSTT